ncbi:MAG: tail fiber domain-containing protein [Bacteroidota bacterium]
MIRLTTLIVIILYSWSALAQNIGINEDGSNPDPSAILDIKASDKGFLVPRLTEAQKNGISSPATGLLIYQHNADSGFFYFNGAIWIPLLSKSIVRLIDEDEDTWVDVEQNPDEDMVRMTLSGTEVLKYSKNANGVSSIELTNNMNNTLLGELSGLNLNPNLSDGIYNTFLGNRAGNVASEVSYSTFVGANAGLNASSSTLNTYLGHNAGFSNDTGAANTALGQQAGYNNDDGSYNTFVGQSAGFDNIGSANTMIGQNAGFNSSMGDFNVFIGERSAYNAAMGSENVVIGSEAGLGLNHGNENVYVGFGAGRSNTGSGNIFIGHRAGENESMSNQLYLDNNNSSFPLLGGDFANDIVFINNTLGVNTQSPIANLDVDGSAIFNKSNANVNFIVRGSSATLISTNGLTDNVGIGHANPAYTLHVRNGSATSNTIFGLGDTEYFSDGTNTISLLADFDPISTFTLDMGEPPFYWDDMWADNFINVSDMRMKENVKPLSYGLNELMQLETYSYVLREDPFQEQKIGLSAQNILSLIPEAVKTTNHELIEGSSDRYEEVELENFGLRYNSLIPVLIKSIQEQQAIIMQLQVEIEKLKKK